MIPRPQNGKDPLVMLKRLATIAFVLSLVGFGVLGYLEVSARVSQERMKSTWDGIEKNEGDKEKDSSPHRKPRGPGRSANGDKQRDERIQQLAVEKRGSGRDQLGVLSIPKIGLEQVVMYGATPKILRRGPGLMKATQYPGRIGNAVIAGHRTTYGFPFRRINELEKGDKIIFQNSSGRMVYKVKRVFRIQPDDRSVLKQTKKKTQLTLLSCDPPFKATYRLIVVAEAS